MARTVNPAIEELLKGLPRTLDMGHVAQVLCKPSKRAAREFMLSELGPSEGLFQLPKGTGKGGRWLIAKAAMRRYLEAIW